jgi:hypothetical protein
MACVIPGHCYVFVADNVNLPTEIIGGTGKSSESKEQQPKGRQGGWEREKILQYCN